MARKSETHDIGPLRVTIGQLPPMRAWPLSTRVFAMLAPALDRIVIKSTKSTLAALARAVQDGDFQAVKSNVDVTALAEAVEVAAMRMQGEDGSSMLREALACTSVVVLGDDGKPRKIDLAGDTPQAADAAIDAAFAGQFWSLWRVFALSLRVNFWDFGDGAGSASPAAPHKASGTSST